MANTLHKNLTAGELHYSKILISGTPPSSIPEYSGESYYNTAGNVFYIATGTASAADWQPVVTGTSVNSEPGTTYTVVSTDNGKVIDMTSSSARTVTLPSNPVNGFQVGIFDGSGNAYTNDITIDATGGKSFWDSTPTYKIVSDYAGITFTFDATSNKWISVSENIGGTLFIDSLLDTVTIDNAIDKTKELQFALAGATTNTKTTIAVSQTANRTITLPDVTDTLVGLAATQTLSNKTFSNNTNTTGITNDTNPIIIKSQNELRFNNPGNTFYSSLKAGLNASNLSWTLPVTAPLNNQSLISSDTSGTLEWAYGTEQTVTKVANINALDNTTSLVLLSGATACNLNGIAAGQPGQKITIFNESPENVTVVTESGSATATDRIIVLNNRNLVIPQYAGLEFIYTSELVWQPTSQIYAENIIGKIPVNTLDVIPVGKIGEMIEKIYNTSTPLVENQYTVVTSIDLTPGIWDLTLNMNISTQALAGIATMEIIIGLSNVAGTTFPDQATQNSCVNSITLSGANLIVRLNTLTVASYRVYIPTPILPATTVPYYAKAYVYGAIGVFTALQAQDTYIKAVRVG
jgi:hypothetical protein